jgi:predicted metal-binding membrane protein
MQSNVALGQILRGWVPLRATSPLQHGQRAVLLVLAVLTVGAWALTIRLADAMHGSIGAVVSGVAPSPDTALHAHHMGMTMREVGEVAVLGMSGATWSLVGFAVFVVAWAVMMAAMMFPGVAPMLLLVHSMGHRESSGNAVLPTTAFAASYLLVWTVVGTITWVVAHGLSEVATRMDMAEREVWGLLALGTVLILAGLYQWSPFKQVCLDHCRSPVMFVIQRWRPGHMGALRLGVAHGLYCLGCCLALFAVLGVMSLAWMLALTLIDFAEKVLPLGRHTSRIVGVAFLVLGVLVASGTLKMTWVV